MADPLQRNPHDPPSSGRLAEDTPRKSSFPLIWLLVLLALGAFGWTIYNRHASQTTPAPTLPANTPPPNTPPTSSTPNPPPPQP